MSKNMFENTPKICLTERVLCSTYISVPLARPFIHIFYPSYWFASRSLWIHYLLRQTIHQAATSSFATSAYVGLLLVGASLILFRVWLTPRLTVYGRRPVSHFGRHSSLNQHVATSILHLVQLLTLTYILLRPRFKSPSAFKIVDLFFKSSVACSLNYTRPAFTNGRTSKNSRLRATHGRQYSLKKV